MIKKIFFIIPILLLFSYAHAEDPKRALADKIMSLEMQIVIMLSENHEGKNQEDLHAEHEVFKGRYVELTSLKSRLEEQFPRLNLDSYIEEILHNKIMASESSHMSRP